MISSTVRSTFRASAQEPQFPVPPLIEDMLILKIPEHADTFEQRAPPYSMLNGEALHPQTPNH